MANAVFQASDENILRDADWQLTEGATIYNLAYFEHLDPSIHLVFAGATATLIAAIVPARGDVLVIPVTNAASLTVLNGSGLSVSVPIPAMPLSGIPLTVVCDLSVLVPDPAIRTSNVWGFSFTSLSGALVVGAAIALYSPRRELLDGDFQWGGSDLRTAFGTVQESSAGVRYLYPRETMRRSARLTKLATETDVVALQGWFDGSQGRFGTALLWPDPDVNDAYLGTLGETFEVTRLAPTVDGPVFSVALQFDELTKGRPIA